MITVILILITIFFIFQNTDLNKKVSDENYPTNKEDIKISQKFSGRWINLEDNSLIREFSEDLTYKDFYNGEMIASGVWYVFNSSDKPVEFIYDTEEGREYLIITSTNSSVSYKIEEVTENSISLISLNNNLSSNFKRE